MPIRQANHRRPPKPSKPRKAEAAAAFRRSSTVSRWGNSLGVRIPQEAVDRLKLQPGARVSFQVRADSITITPVRKSRKWTEAELLKGVTPEAVAGEIDWGAPRGREVW